MISRSSPWQAFQVLALLTRISPVAWQHILLNGHYRFQNEGKTIDLDLLIAGLEL
jgi:hypothetical protein